MSFKKKPKTVDPDEVDPSVYYYDEVYDDMKEEETTNSQRQDDNRRGKQESKYIQGIKETADRRKSEKEIRKFKKYARDREEAEASGELDDTDVYVSLSYEKKLKEVRDALDKNSKADEDLELNAFKRQKKNDQGGESSHDRLKLQSFSKQSGDKDAAQSKTTEVGHAKEEQLASEVRLRRPKTIEERRQFLREVLKKQTVGEAFEAAVQRYKQRKALVVAS